MLQEELTVSIVCVLFLCFFFCAFELSENECSKGEFKGEDEGRGKGLWGHMLLLYSAILTKLFCGTTSSRVSKYILWTHF